MEQRHGTSEHNNSYYQAEAGGYTVTVTDANGCEAVKSITIEDPERAGALRYWMQRIETCAENNDGTATESAWRHGAVQLPVERRPNGHRSHVPAAGTVHGDGNGRGRL